MMKRSVSLLVVICAMATLGASGAVVQRSANTSSRASVSRTPVAAATARTNDTAVETTEPEQEIVESVVIENKASQFDTSLDDAMLSKSDLAGTDLAAQIRAQRAALDAADRLDALKIDAVTTNNSCDNILRQCMMDKCGGDFTNCASDTDTTFGTKLDACRRNTKCTANEFKLLSGEIKSDRAANIKLKSFNNIIKCGTDYDACITTQCGTTYSKCLGKSAGDNAIAKCAAIARECTSSDNGLANRTMNVFSTLRQNAEKQIAADEQKLYSLRDQMKSVCSRLGAMFDERSLECVYTVGFYAGGDSTLYASKKAYAGSTFDCTPNWFGVDVTTFRENAYRLTREQTSASGAMLGAGVGMAVGAVTSGAINRAIDTHTAERDEKKAECENAGNTWNSFLGKCSEDTSIDDAERAAEKTRKSEERRAQREANRAQRNTSATSESGINDITNKLSTSTVQSNDKPGDKSVETDGQDPDVPTGDHYTSSDQYDDMTIEDIGSGARSQETAIEMWLNRVGDFIVTKHCPGKEGYLNCESRTIKCVGDAASDNFKEDLDVYCDKQVTCFDVKGTINCQTTSDWLTKKLKLQSEQ